MNKITVLNNQNITCVVGGIKAALYNQETCAHNDSLLKSAQRKICDFSCKPIIEEHVKYEIKKHAEHEIHDFRKRYLITTAAGFALGFCVTLIFADICKK